MTIRTQGWVQNPSSFTHLKKVVQVFDPGSEHYKNLISMVDSTIFFEEERNSLIKKLQNGNAVFTHLELVGTSRDKYGNSTNTRANQVADSLLKITILPQNFNTTGRRHTDAWTAEGFLRWSVCLNFVNFDRNTDTYKLTPLGLKFSESKLGSLEEKEILRKAFLCYPPATQVLNILEQNKDVPVDKFYIGSQLGFTGERGFTSYGSDTMQEWLSVAESAAEFNSIKSDYEGTSDKYARMICGWLYNVDFVEKHRTNIVSPYGQTGFQRYSITARGSRALGISQGRSSNRQTPKFLMWEFLATKAPNTNRVRTRRAQILKILERTQSWNSLVQQMNTLGFNENEKIFIKDINGLNQFGIRIERSGNRVKLLDSLVDFDIPQVISTIKATDIEIENIKNQLIISTDLPDKYYELVDISYDGKRNRDFEIYTMDLFNEVYGFETALLGGGRKPDGLAYTNDFGIIVDTKAYSTGYSKSISQEDEMVRYIEDNQLRDFKRNPTRWWENFSSTITNDNFYFLWVSSRFIGQFSDQLVDISRRTSINGGALNVEQLLIGADQISKNQLSLNDLPKYMNNNEIFF